MDFLASINMEKLFLYVGIISTAIYLIKIIIFSIASADTDIPEGHIDVDGTDSDIAFNFLSIQSIIAFFMGFGWTGLACIKSNKIEIYVTCFIAFVVGLLFMGLSAYLTYLLKSLNKRETFDMNKVVGTVGKAYSTFQPKNTGRIEIEINSKLTIVDAQNNSEEEIPSFTPIKVVKYENNIFYIEKA